MSGLFIMENHISPNKNRLFEALLYAVKYPLSIKMAKLLASYQLVF